MTQPASGVAVKYTGRETPFIERNYGSGLSFDPGQSRIVPDELAARLLRHADVFAAAKRTDAPPEAKRATDDTQTALEQADKAKTEQAALDNNRQDVVDQVNLMDKDALKDFAHIKYGQPLNKTFSVENLRAQVVGFIDMYGLV